MKAVIYARYSSDKQDEYSIEGQLKDCYEYAARNNIEVVREYIDRAITGRTDKRPSLQEMIFDSANGGFDAVLVWKIDRFFRNMEMNLKYKRMLKQNGVRVISINEPIDDNDASGFLVGNMFSMFAEWYSIDLSQKMKRGQRLKAQECLYLGGTIPLGYKVVNQHFELDEVYAPIVKEAFLMYVDGVSITEICNRLNKRGLKSSTGKPFNKNTFSKVFTNKRYAGYYIHDTTEIKGGIPSIIDEETFNAAQIRAEKNKKHPTGRMIANYLFQDKLICGYCNQPMIGSAGTSGTGKEYFYYVCKNHTVKHICRKKNEPKAPIEDLVVDLTINDILSNKRLINSIVKQCQKEYDTYLKNDATLLSYNKALQETNNAIKNIMVAIENGIFTSSTKDRLNELELKKEELELAIKKEKLNHLTLSEEDILNFFNYCRTNINAIKDNFKLKKALIDAFVDKVVVTDDDLEITYNCYDGTNKKVSKVLTPSKAVHQFTNNKNFELYIYPNFQFKIVIQR